MRVLLLWAACATADPTPDHPPKSYDECQAQCKTAVDLCNARCMGTGGRNAMADADCRQNCWQYDSDCHAHCEKAFKPK